MQPSQWTSTYNNQFRDRRNYISPHSQQPMHHYADQYDPSHWVKTQGYYGTRAALSEHAARTAELQARGQDMGGQTYRVSQPLAQTQAYASGSMTARSAPLPRMSQSGPITYTHGFSSGRDLWNTPTKPHSGVYSDHVNIGVGSGQGFRTLSFAPHVSTLNHTQKSSGVDYWSKQSGEFDSHHSSVSGVSLYRDTTPRNKYHLPGYAGFVRGRQFLHGDTYGKTTRSCLDVPVDVSLEP